MTEQLIDLGADTSPEGLKSRIDAMMTGMEALRQSTDRTLAGLNAMPDDTLKAAGLVQLQRDLSRAVFQMIDAEGKAEDALRQQTGGGGIDFDAARAALRSRLDSIRSAGSEGSVPEGIVGE